MREETEKRIFTALKRHKKTWRTAYKIKTLARVHFYAVLVFVARHRRELDRVSFGSKVYFRLKV